MIPPQAESLETSALTAASQATHSGTRSLSTRSPGSTSVNRMMPDPPVTRQRTETQRRGSLKTGRTVTCLPNLTSPSQVSLDSIFSRKPSWEASPPQPQLLTAPLGARAFPNISHFMADCNRSLLVHFPTYTISSLRAELNSSLWLPSDWLKVGAVRPYANRWVHLHSQNTLNALNSIQHWRQGIIYKCLLSLWTKNLHFHRMKTPGWKQQGSRAPSLPDAKMMEQASFSSRGDLVAQSWPTLATSWTVAHQVPLSRGFSRQEHWSGLPSPPGDLPNPGIEPACPALHADSLPLTTRDSLQFFLLKNRTNNP